MYSRDCCACIRPWLLRRHISGVLTWLRMKVCRQNITAAFVRACLTDGISVCGFRRLDHIELSFFNNSRTVDLMHSFLQKGALHDMSFLQVSEDNSCAPRLASPLASPPPLVPPSPLPATTHCIQRARGISDRLSNNRRNQLPTSCALNLASSPMSWQVSTSDNHMQHHRLHVSSSCPLLCSALCVRCLVMLCCAVVSCSAS